jgi:hypothetical protein
MARLCCISGVRHFGRRLLFVFLIPSDQLDPHHFFCPHPSHSHTINTQLRASRGSHGTHTCTGDTGDHRPGGIVSRNKRPNRMHPCLQELVRHVPSSSMANRSSRTQHEEPMLPLSYRPQTRCHQRPSTFHTRTLCVQKDEWIPQVPIPQPAPFGDMEESKRRRNTRLMNLTNASRSDFDFCACTLLILGYFVETPSSQELASGVYNS